MCRGGCYHVCGQYFDACHVGLYFLVMHLFAGFFAGSIEFGMKGHLQQLISFDVTTWRREGMKVVGVGECDESSD